MKISPVSLYKTNTFRGAEKPQKDEKQTTLPKEYIIEAQKQVESAKQDIARIKDAAEKEKVQASTILAHSQKYQKKIQDILDDPTGIKNAPENTVFTPKKENGVTEIHESDLFGNVYKITSLKPDGKIYIREADTQTGEVNIYSIDKKKKTATVMLGVKISDDNTKVDEVYKFSNGKLNRYEKDVEVTPKSNRQGKIYAFKNNKPAKVMLDSYSTERFTSVQEAFIYNSNEDFEEYIGKYVNTPISTATESSFLQTENNKSFYTKNDYRISFDKNKAIEYIKFSDAKKLYADYIIKL